MIILNIRRQGVSVLCKTIYRHNLDFINHPNLNRQMKLSSNKQRHLSIAEIDSCLRPFAMSTETKGTCVLQN